MPADPNADYDETTDTSAYAIFAGTCEVVQGKGGFSLVGKCPRCGHEMSFPYPKEVVGRRILRRLRPQPKPPERGLAVLCTCTEPHHKRPEDETGCGAYWTVGLEGSGS